MPSTPRRPSRPATVLDGIPTAPRRARRQSSDPAPGPHRRGAGLAAGLLVLTGVIVLLLALPLNHVRKTAEPDRLASHATAVLEDPEARDALADEATTRIANRVAGDSGLTHRAARAAVAPAVERLVASERFAATWNAAVRIAATRLLDPSVPYVAVSIGDLDELTAAAGRPFPAAIERSLRRAGPVAIMHVDRTPEQQRGLETLEWLNGLSVPLLIVGVVAFLLALAVSRDRRRTVISIGAALIVLALLLLGLQALIHAAVLDAADPGRARDVTGVVWDELMGDFRTQNLIGLGLGAVLIVGGLATGRRSRERLRAQHHRS